MKHLVVSLLCVMLLVSAIPYTYAVENREYCHEWVMENGITVVEELIFENDSRTMQEGATRRQTYRDEDQNLMAVIAMRVVFQYDGSTVRVISKSMTQTDTYNGWSYDHDCYVTIGGKVTTKFYLEKQSYSQLYSFSVTCDKNGNIS